MAAAENLGVQQDSTYRISRRSLFQKVAGFSIAAGLSAIPRATRADAPNPPEGETEPSNYTISFLDKPFQIDTPPPTWQESTTTTSDGVKKVMFDENKTDTHMEIFVDEEGNASLEQATEDELAALKLMWDGIIKPAEYSDPVVTDFDLSKFNLPNKFKMINISAIKPGNTRQEDRNFEIFMLQQEDSIWAFTCEQPRKNYAGGPTSQLETDSVNAQENFYKLVKSFHFS